MSAMEKQSGEFTRVNSDFISKGTRCAGWLYRPAGAAETPVVIMGHGFAAERTFRLPAFAEAFAKKGLSDRKSVV